MSSSWIVEHRCTQCGAPITLEEADRFFACPFCRVKICLTTDDHFRYYLQPMDEPQEEIFYVPFWRVRGIWFTCDEELEIKNSIVDATYCGFHGGPYPESLGLRPQALKLRFATPESGMLFPEPPQAFNAIFDKIEGGLPQYHIGNSPVHVFHRSFLGEKVSIVYAPFFLKNRALHDGILGKPLKALRDGMSNVPPQGSTGRPLTVIPALCPECGWDLEGGRDSVVFFCRNCNRAWYLTKNRLERKDFIVLNGRSQRDMAYLPFWRIKAHIEGLQLKTMADLARLANLPVVVRKEWESRDIYFWVPGFKVHAPLFLRLARLLTLQQPADFAEHEEPLANPQKASLPADDAGQSITVIIAGLIAVKKRMWPSLESVITRPVHSDLVYIPFQEQEGDYFNPSLKVSVPKNSLKFGQNL